MKLHLERLEDRCTPSSLLHRGFPALPPPPAVSVAWTMNQFVFPGGFKSAHDLKDFVVDVYRAGVKTERIVPPTQHSVSFPLPHGVYDVVVTAHSKDGLIDVAVINFHEKL